MRNFILVLLFLPAVFCAQEKKPFIGQGLFTGKGTLAIGKPLTYSGTNMYISGNLEYYIQKNISFRGGVWFFLDSDGMQHPFSNNSGIFTGYYYHFPTKSHLDPYMGFEPGVSWTRLAKPEHPENEPEPYNRSAYPASINPMASVTAGLHYYASKWTHLFMEVKYAAGTHISDIPAVSLNEFRVAFGFGFNIWTLRKET
ncbi:MAG: hypothetical protein IT233_09340 [Bacteroidia bacterium]|nr:hypothetical protein [Bacteroidia bacterium]